MNTWKIVSVKSPSKGFQKRDPFCEPIRCCQHDANVIFLRRAAEFLLSWKAVTQTRGLIAETSLACSHTFKALADLAEFLISRHDFDYVLLGKFSSDPIEGRFGMYRQFSGGNFYISVKQLLDSEKKIRILNLLHQRVLHAAASLSGDLNLGESTVATADVTWLVNHISLDSFHIDDLNGDDGNILYFVAGYIGRSIFREKKCANCKSLLIEDKSVSNPSHTAIPQEYRHLFQHVDKGGLAAPSDILYAICVLGMLTYHQVGQQSLNCKLLS